jgi:hypothetical protein
MGKESELYDPYNTKTLGGTTKLDVETYENVQNSIHLERTNRKLLELTDLIGRVANTRSSSGPLPGTQILLDTDSITNSEITVYKPEIGEVYQLVAASITTLDGASTMILKLSDDTSTPGAQIDTSNTTSDAIVLNEPIFITNDVWLKVRTSNASSGNARLATSFIRVR